MSENENEMPLGLYWKDKKTTVDRTVLPFQHLEVIETINESRETRKKREGNLFAVDPETVDTSWRNKLIWGDNKYVMSALLEQFAGKIDLVYIDPPFATGANFDTTVKIGNNQLKHTKEASAMEELAYRDTWGKGLDSFLQIMYERLVLMKMLLADKGSIYVHIDWRTASYIKLIMDEIFGIDNFLNEIVWCYHEREISNNHYNRKHDTILFYAKNSKNQMRTFNCYEIVEDYSELSIKKYSLIDNDGRKFQIRGKGGNFTGKQQLPLDIEKKYPELVYRDYLDKKLGVLPRDWFTNINFENRASKNRTDYPTQKPEALLKKFTIASSNKDDLVADFFCGSGTTAAVAEKLSRRWIACDLGRFAIHTTRKRMLEIEDCKPFEILNIGKYERQFWQGFTFGKKSKEQTLAEYISFILKLYKSDPIPGSNLIHGKKGKQLVHVGSVEAPVTLEDIQTAIQETLQMKQKELVILGWEWQMGLHDVVEAEAKKAGVKLSLLNIPREAMDMRAVDAGDVQFFELAYLETSISEKSSGYVIKLEDFVIPNLDLIPLEVKKKIKKWSDYIDYWSVDWNYKNDTFHNMWQTYRTKQDRTLPLKTDPYKYNKNGKYSVMIKVIDIFGNDTTHIIDLKSE